MSGLTLKRKEEPLRDGQRVTARLNSRLMPMDRGEIYEDPLAAILRQAALGEVTGGGTELDEDGEPAFCDIELTLFAGTPENLDRIAKALEGCGAPKGSRLILEGAAAALELGVNEGLAIYLDGVSLPDDVYESCDFDTVVESLNEALGDKGRYHGFWQSERETAVYLYGPSAAEMEKAVAPFLARYPLCQGARVEQIA